ncbi:pancreatic lipase-related protein 3-like [Anabrus simplex]|uniref:pancreatic lipase-related protein 3-like n=1 Tax=Anabrus simplex TaxID=316456 RepID=UPI0035A3621B
MADCGESLQSNILEPEHNGNDYDMKISLSKSKVMSVALLRAGESNILVVDWGMLSARPCYPAAVVNTLHTGKCTAQLLHALVKRFPSMSLSQVHAIGFSLGAHVAAFASNSLMDSLGTTLGRITGLDPALPLFATLKDSWKLDSSDANFVDVIHTNVGVFGKIEAVGHADFYVNGGSVQPACAETENVPLCSHMLAPVYFAESVQTPLGFWGTPCASYLQYTWGGCPDTEERVLMGEHCNTSTRGVFFVDTGSSPPYALG